ncbi:MAG: hypothetical protein ACR2QC_04090 [Gammaproteobacteria bacterium]
MSKEAWGDEGNIPASAQDTQIWHDLCEIQKRLFQFYADHNEYEFPNDEFVNAYKRADEAIQDMFEQLED